MGALDWRRVMGQPNHENAGPVRGPVHVRNVAGGIVGNVIEWYDFALFGFLAPVLSELFFPADDLLAGLIKTYGIFAAGYVMRPLGGILFGHIGDRIGRKRALELSVALMTLPTVALGFMPTEASIGLWAPVGLVTLRLLQGLSVGGELIGSIIFLGEIAPPGRRGLYCSGGGTGVTLGLLLGSGAAAALDGLLDAETIHAFAWRIPFLAGILLGGLGLWIRNGMTESAVFEEGRNEREAEHAPIVEVLRHHGLVVAQLFAASLLFAAAFYVIFIWLPTYLSTIMQPAAEGAVLFNTIAMLLLMGFLPMAGALSDRFGRRAILLVGAAAFVGLSAPFFVGSSQRIVVGGFVDPGHLRAHDVVHPGHHARHHGGNVRDARFATPEWRWGTTSCSRFSGARRRWSAPGSSRRPATPWRPPTTSWALAS